jgi:hypothetical protein
MTHEASDTFSPKLIEALNTTDEVDIETVSPSGTARRTTIWIVTDGTQAYVRSERGTAGRWYRNLVETPTGALHVGSDRVAIHGVQAVDPASIELVSELFREKYGKRFRGSTQAMLQPDTLETTLRLDPA